MRARVRYVQAACLLATTLVAGSALADKVAVLPFLATSSATSAELDAARDATRVAVTGQAHTLPSDAELLTAQMSSKDGVVDTGEEYRAAGRASTSDWTVVGHVEGHGPTYRLELDVCQVETGRVESLAREITPAQASAQVAEMLALLVRPDGIANAAIPWERSGPQAPATPKEPGPPPPPEEPAVKHTYAEGHPIALGAFVSVLGAFSRPSDATGSSTAALLGLTGAYAFHAVPGLEVRTDFDFSIAGPESINADGGLRYAFPILPSARLFVGPEVELGGFFANGALKTPRFLMQGAAFAAIGVGERVQIELVGDLAYAAGSPPLALAGGTLRGLVRF